jgi:hypothetical protein
LILILNFWFAIFFPPNVLYFHSTLPGVSLASIQKPGSPVTVYIRHFGSRATVTMLIAAGFKPNRRDPCPDCSAEVTRLTVQLTSYRRQSPVSKLRAASQSRTGAILLRVCEYGNSFFQKNGYFCESL